MRRHVRSEDAAERLTRAAFRDVVELLVTGLAFGLVGLEVRQVIQDEGAAISGMLPAAVAISVLVIVVRFLWFAQLLALSRKNDGALPPTNFKDVGIFSWCGMRGLATLALALAQRAQAAAIAALRDNDFMKSLPPGRIALVKTNMRRLHAELLDGDLCSVPAAERTRRGHELAIAVQTIAIDAARSEVLSARHEPAADPEVVDKVLRQLDLRTMIMPELQNEI